MSLMTRDRPDLREQIATAANTSDLGPDGAAASVMGAIGAASMVMVTGADGTRRAKLTEAGTAEVHPGRRLAALLERGKYALDHKATKQAVILFAHFLKKKSVFCNRLRLRTREDLLMRFAGQVVTEWVHDRCAQCGGGGWVTLGKASRNAKTELCGVCRGGGRARVEHHTRVTVLQVPKSTYDAHWIEAFDQALGWLGEIEGSNMGALQSQLRRGTLRSDSTQSGTDNK